MTTSDTAGEAAQVQLDEQPEATVTKPRSLQAMRQLEDTPPPFPFGWFAVAFSRELRKGQILTRQFMDREIVLFRTRSGTARAIEAYCPHLGAHFGHGGKVCGEELRCPFHGFRFSVDGACVHSPLGAAPPAARLGILELREVCGVMLVWHGPVGQVPWEIGSVDDESDWGRPAHWTMRLRTHPQEITENGVDSAHIPELHAVKNLRVIEPFTADGPRFRIAYAFTRRPLGMPPRNVELRIQSDGLGLSRFETEIAGIGTARQLSLATPISESETVLRLGVSMRKRGRSAVDVALGIYLDAVVGPGVLMGMIPQVKRDARMWNNKKYLRRPAVAAGDGPIPAYRQWAAQFYPEGADC